MKGKDFQSELIDYLYGEMSEEDRLDFEQKMDQHPELKVEYEALKKVRSELSGMADTEATVSHPSFLSTGRLTPKETSRESVIFRSILAVAASITLLMLIGFITDFNLAISTDGVQLGFHSKPEEPVQKVLTEAEIRSMLKDELEKSNSELLTSAAKTNEVTDTRIVSLEKSLKKISANNAQAVVTKEDLNNFLTMVEERNTEAIRQFMTTISTQQQQYFKATFTQYNDYLQLQRQDDLSLIRSEFIEMKQSQTQQKHQTDQVLASLISTVSAK